VILKFQKYKNIFNYFKAHIIATTQSSMQSEKTQGDVWPDIEPRDPNITSFMEPAIPPSSGGDLEHMLYRLKNPSGGPYWTLAQGTTVREETAYRNTRGEGRSYRCRVMAHKDEMISDMKTVTGRTKTILYAQAEQMATSESDKKLYAKLVTKLEEQVCKLETIKERAEIHQELLCLDTASCAFIRLAAKMNENLHQNFRSMHAAYGIQKELIALGDTRSWDHDDHQHAENMLTKICRLIRKCQAGEEFSSEGHCLPTVSWDSVASSSAQCLANHYANKEPHLDAFGLNDGPACQST